MTSTDLKHVEKNHKTFLEAMQGQYIYSWPPAQGNEETVGFRILGPTLLEHTSGPRPDDRGPYVLSRKMQEPLILHPLPDGTFKAELAAERRPNF